jgi:hypothetical protein
MPSDHAGAAVGVELRTKAARRLILPLALAQFICSFRRLRAGLLLIGLGLGVMLTRP